MPTRAPAAQRDRARRRARRPDAAVAPSPRRSGPAGARDPLALEVRLLGSLLGQVIAEQAGRELLDLVERVRRTTIRLRRGDDPAIAGRLERSSTRLDLGGPRPSIAAFALYFQLVNLAEERARVRALRRRERAARDGRARRLGRRGGRAGCAGAGRDRGRARRRSLERPADQPGPDRPPDRGSAADRRSIALRRCRPRCSSGSTTRDSTPSEDRDIRRRLREEITLLWRTADLRADRAGRRSTRSGRRSPSSTRRCSRVVPAALPRADAALDRRRGARSTPPGADGRCRPDRDAAAARPGRSCAGSRGSAAIATATRP